MERDIGCSLLTFANLALRCLTGADCIFAAVPTFPLAILAAIAQRWRMAPV
jgi:hypothetical protein